MSSPPFYTNSQKEETGGGEGKKPEARFSVAGGVGLSHPPSPPCVASFYIRWERWEDEKREGLFSLPPGYCCTVVQYGRFEPLLIYFFPFSPLRWKMGEERRG